MSVRMAKRYGFKPINGREMSSMLNACDLSMMQFCRTTGSDERRVQRWLDGQEDIPMWVGSLLIAMKDHAAAARVSTFVLERTWDNRQGDLND